MNPEEAAAKAAEGNAFEKQRVQDMQSEEYTFDFKWEAPNGQPFEGRFTNHIVNNNMRNQISTVSAQLRGGMPYGSLNPMTSDFQDRLAHITISMPIKDRPKWAQGTGGFGDLLWDEIVYKLHGEAALHEATFRGRGED